MVLRTLYTTMIVFSSFCFSIAAMEKDMPRLQPISEKKPIINEMIDDRTVSLLIHDTQSTKDEYGNQFKRFMITRKMLDDVDTDGNIMGDKPEKEEMNELKQLIEFALQEVEEQKSFFAETKKAIENNVKMSDNLAIKEKQEFFLAVLKAAPQNVKRAEELLEAETLFLRKRLGNLHTCSQCELLLIMARLKVYTREDDVFTKFSFAPKHTMCSRISELIAFIGPNLMGPNSVASFSFPDFSHESQKGPFMGKKDALELRSFPIDESLIFYADDSNNIFDECRFDYKKKEAIQQFSRVLAAVIEQKNAFFFKGLSAEFDAPETNKEKQLEPKMVIVGKEIERLEEIKERFNKKNAVSSKDLAFLLRQVSYKNKLEDNMYHPDSDPIYQLIVKDQKGVEQSFFCTEHLAQRICQIHTIAEEYAKRNIYCDEGAQRTYGFSIANFWDEKGERKMTPGNYPALQGLYNAMDVRSSKNTNPSFGWKPLRKSGQEEPITHAMTIDETGGASSSGNIQYNNGNMILSAIGQTGSNKVPGNIDSYLDDNSGELHSFGICDTPIKSLNFFVAKKEIEEGRELLKLLPIVIEQKHKQLERNAAKLDEKQLQKLKQELQELGNTHDKFDRTGIFSLPDLVILLRHVSHKWKPGESIYSSRDKTWYRLVVTDEQNKEIYSNYFEGDLAECIGHVHLVAQELSSGDIRLDPNVKPIYGFFVADSGKEHLYSGCPAIQQFYAILNLSSGTTKLSGNITNNPVTPDPVANYYNQKLEVVHSPKKKKSLSGSVEKKLQSYNHVIPSPEVIKLLSRVHKRCVIFLPHFSQEFINAASNVSLQIAPLQVKALMERIMGTILKIKANIRLCGKDSKDIIPCKRYLQNELNCFKAQGKKEKISVRDIVYTIPWVDYWYYDREKTDVRLGTMLTYMQKIHVVASLVRDNHIAVGGPEKKVEMYGFSISPLYDENKILKKPFHPTIGQQDFYNELEKKMMQPALGDGKISGIECQQAS